MQATYHKKKIYVPDAIAEKLHLKDGDKVEYSVQGEDAVSLKIKRKKSAKDLLLKRLGNPVAIQAKHPVRRRVIYEDLT
jgi:bifunctional DNA-binding transcriptional regulator/antitoxin component of YhaV-PrlF toxin-antitoxin module